MYNDSQLNLWDEETYDRSDLLENKPPPRSLKPEPTDLYDVFWYFAFERQNVFFRKLHQSSPPFTQDAILGEYKFTNAYRASDRVSQYLIQNVIYDNENDYSLENVFFRVILFKTFNRTSTWELLEDKLESIRYDDYSFRRYSNIIDEAMAKGQPVYSAAYMMASGKHAFGYSKKHRNHLRLIETMMDDQLPRKISEQSSMKGAFNLLKTYPTIGDFLAYQYVTDLNYSEITDFDEMDFVMPGPGAKDGIKKCFSDRKGYSEQEIIRMMANRQGEEFDRLGLRFKSLWGRPLKLIDCQNLFCEVAKYSRKSHPNIKGLSGRSRIKQKYTPSRKTIDYWYPPKWGINEKINR